MQPSDTKIYHIVHIDKLASVLEDGHLWCDAEVERRASSGTGIGMADIKQRRRRLPLDSDRVCMWGSAYRSISVPVP
ncbi:DarT ssDNA thymidine ADP-ribosyltransferase family protein [Chlorobium phaeovibrioides]|uniref:DarT ssDNA thymidine ADP-ribosyltransferase family protein n=1 Tax=Chlorobium phaeovibrioides TaxID=1094 RepID=UPI0037BE7C61